jgi:tRNA pseudouridine38-40 synthase
MLRVRLTLAFDGTRFHGWQIQETTGKQPRTVQGTVEEALKRIAGERIRVHGSGRTDAGVHALDQNAHFDAPESKANVPWQRALNALLPDDVRVTAAAAVAPDFHARHSSSSKTYAYSFWLNGRYVLPQRRHYTWRSGPLDVSAMEEASKRLVGTHDFAGFQNVGTEVGSTVRTVTDISRCVVDDLGATDHESVWRITADGFLKQMARNVFGLLAEVGRGKLAPRDADAVLATSERAPAPYPTAPARGLTLVRVRYE